MHIKLCIYIYTIYLYVYIYLSIYLSIYISTHPPLPPAPPPNELPTLFLYRKYRVDTCTYTHTGKPGSKSDMITSYKVGAIYNILG